MDTTQLLLTIVLSLTTILLVVIGLQLFFVLRETQRMLKHVNKVVTSFESLGTGFEHGMSEIMGFVQGIRTVLRAVDVIKGKDKK